MNRTHRNTPRPALLSLACALALVAGCATSGAVSQAQARPNDRTQAPLPSLSDDWEVSAKALRAQQWSVAREPLSRLLQQDLRNGHLQFLHAVVEENDARDRDRGRLELASVGYANAAKFAPGQYWALLHLGFLELERDEATAAQGYFSEAALDQPGRWEAFYGLGVASYYRRDLPMLHLASQRALELAPDRPETLRLNALALAVQGDAGAEAMAERAVLREGKPEQAHFERRVGEFLTAASMTVAQDTAPAFGEPVASFDELAAVTEPPTQVVVEVTILLNSVLDQSTRGVNLFDGLRMLYGYSNTLASTITNAGRQNTRTITSQISTPQLDYSLNLFNDSGQYYSVVARPSITAHLGKESKFFAGRTLNVEVSGVNLGQLQPIDVGVGLQVIPELIDGKKVRFQVGAERSFLSQEQIGTFSSSLTTFRQSVSATADVEFGQTLVLSALSEEVSDRSFSKIPGVGDIPVIRNLARRDADLTRQESLLILVTPKLPLSLSTPETAEQRQHTTQQLLSLWQERVDPRADVPAIIERLKRSRWLRQPEAGDLRMRLPEAQALQREAIEESLLLARR